MLIYMVYIDNKERVTIYCDKEKKDFLTYISKKLDLSYNGTFLHMLEYFVKNELSEDEVTEVKRRIKFNEKIKKSLEMENTPTIKKNTEWDIMEKPTKKQLEDLRKLQDKYNLHDQLDCFKYLLNEVVKQNKNKEVLMK